MGMAGSTAYLDAVSQGTISAGTTETVYALYVGAQNYQDGPIRYYMGNIQAVAIYSDTLTAGEVAVVSTAMSLL